jgi:hypothetical protein
LVVVIVVVVAATAAVVVVVVIIIIIIIINTFYSQWNDLNIIKRRKDLYNIAHVNQFKK